MDLITTVQGIIGEYVWQLVIAIFATIPVWFLVDTIKKRITLWTQRRFLINQSILSVGNWYEICGTKGKLKFIDSKLIHLEDEDDLLIHISISLVVNNVVRSIKPPKLEEEKKL